MIPPVEFRMPDTAPNAELLRSLGRSGVTSLIDGLCANAALFASGVAALDGARVENDVVFTQVCATFGSDSRTEEVTRRLLADGTAWMSGSRWAAPPHPAHLDEQPVDGCRGCPSVWPYPH